MRRVCHSPASLCPCDTPHACRVLRAERGKQGVEDEQRTFTKLEDVAAALDSRGLAWDVYYDGQEERAFWQGEAAVAMKRALVLRVSAQ